MKIFRGPLSISAILILFSVFLVTAGLSRFIETDSGNILIHDIDAESYEGFMYGARLYRPLQASSMNQRPSVLLIFGTAGDRYTGDHIAMEFARRGFVVLTMEDFSRGMTGPEPDFYTENLVDTGYTFLATRSFTDHSRIGLAAFYDGAYKAVEAASFSSFASRAFICPPSGLSSGLPDDILTLSAKYESLPAYRNSSASLLIPAFHSGMLVNRSVLSALAEHFQNELKIPNDTPFWFDASSQRAQLLIGLRMVLLILLLLITAGISGRISAGGGKIYKTAAAVIVPLLIFQGTSEIMNFFLISVRIGSPFHYLPRLVQLRKHFSLSLFAGIFIFAQLIGLRFRKGARTFFISDCIAVAGVILCTAVFIPVLFSHTSVLGSIGIENAQWILLIITVLSAAGSVLFRLSDGKRTSVFASAAVSGIMFYCIFCSLPAAALF